jgi:hypothetical protein
LHHVGAINNGSDCPVTEDGAEVVNVFGDVVGVVVGKVRMGS